MSRRHYKSISGGGVLPDGYAECEYIESTGTQYIDTLINPYDKDYSYIAKGGFRILTNDKQTLFGNDTMDININSNGEMIIGSKKFVFNIGVIYNIEFSKMGTSKKLKIYDLFEEQWSSSYQYDASLTVFCEKYKSPPLIRWAHGILSRVEVNVLGMKNIFVAALRISDNKPGLFDLCGSICPLTGTPFYVNAGSGEFLYKLK